jgi:hypothetical protein
MPSSTQILLGVLFAVALAILAFAGATAVML